MMYTMPKNLLSICVNFALATQRKICIFSTEKRALFLRASVARRTACNRPVILYKC